MQKHLLMLGFLFFSIVSFSQNTITGKTINEKNDVVSDCHVHIGSKTTSSNNEGFYKITNLTSGKIKVSVSCIGHQSIDTVINITGDIDLNFVLKTKKTSLKEVLVKTKNTNFNKSVLEQKIKAETIEKYSNQSLGDALKEVTGVSLLKTGSNIIKPIINGLHSSRVPIIANNVRLEDQQWGSEHAPNFDVNATSKITIIKGASGLQFGGDAVGGLVVLEPIIVKKDTLFGKTILSLVSNGRGGTITTSMHQGKEEGWSWNALSTFKYLGDKNAPNYVLSNTGNREINFTGDVSYTGKKYTTSAFYSLYNANNGILSASHTGNVNDLYNSINNFVPAVINNFTYSINNPRQKVQHHIGKLNYNYFFDENSSLLVQYAFQYNKRLEYDVRRADLNHIAALDLQLSTHTLNVDFKKEYHDWNFKMGGNMAYQNNFANPETGIRPLIPNYDKLDAGLYGTANHNFTDNTTFEAGMRYDYSNFKATKYYLKSRWEERNYSPNFNAFIVGEQGNQWLVKPEFVFNNIAASLGIHHKMQNNWELYINAALATRNPNPSEYLSDGLHHSTGVIELGDLNLKKEKSYKIMNSLTKQWKTFSFSISPFLNQIDQYIFLKPVGFETTIRGAFPVWEYQQTKALLTGFDLDAKWNISPNWNHLFSLAYLKGKDITNNTFLIDMPPLNINNKIQFRKKQWHHWMIELKSEITTRQYQFPNNNFTTNIIINQEPVQVNVDISTPPKAYHLLHLYSEMKFKPAPKIIATIAFSVQNICNQTYRDYLNRQRFFADEMGRNFQIQLKINY